MDRRAEKMNAGHKINNVIDEEFMYREGFKRNPANLDDLTTVETEFYTKTPLPNGDYRNDKTVVVLSVFLCPRSQNKVTI